MPLDMIAETDAAMAAAAWPSNSIFVSGIAPMSPSDFNRLIAVPTNAGNREAIPENETEFVNCCCVWIKNAQGKVNKVYQPKLKPSRPEQATQGMYKGETVYLFHSDVLTFCCLLCFDCISLDFEHFTSALTNNVEAGQSQNLHLTLVLEHNEHPENTEFISFAERLLTPGVPALSTGLAAAVGFVNSAHSEHGRAAVEHFGRSSLCYVRRGNWTPCGESGPLTLVPSTFAMETIGNTLLRVRFREDGPALHIFTYFIPALIGSHAGATKFPIDEARMQRVLVDGTTDTPQIVSALTKVISDWLMIGTAQADQRFVCSHRELEGHLRQSLSKVVLSLTTCSTDRLEEAVTLLLAPYVSPARPGGFNPDTWQAQHSNWITDPRGQALLEMASTCALLTILSPIDFEHCDHSHTCKFEDVLITILDGNNVRHSFHIWDVYSGWLGRFSWGETIGKTTLLLITRAASMPCSKHIVPVDTVFTEPSPAELASLPSAIQPQSESILNVEQRFYWISAAALRNAQSRPTLKDAQTFLRGALEPERVS
jgi:hypothetical protein